MEISVVRSKYFSKSKYGIQWTFFFFKSVTFFIFILSKHGFLLYEAKLKINVSNENINVFQCWHTYVKLGNSLN